MTDKMFCFQCEQTAGSIACTGNAGVCGKKADVSNLQDELTGALIGLARATQGAKAPMSTHRVMMNGLFTTITNVNFNEKTVSALTGEVHKEKQKLMALAKEPVCTDNYDMQKLWNDNEDIRSLKSLILFGLRGVAAYAYHADVLGYQDETIFVFFYKGMIAIGDDLNIEQLLPIVE